MRRLLNWIFGKKIQALEMENMLLKSKSKYMPVEIYKASHNSDVLMAPEFLASICQIASDKFYVYFMFDIREQILEMKDKDPVQIMAMLDTLKLIDSSICVCIKAYADSQRKVIYD